MNWLTSIGKQTLVVKATADWTTGVAEGSSKVLNSKLGHHSLAETNPIHPWHDWFAFCFAIDVSCLPPVDAIRVG